MLIAHICYDDAAAQQSPLLWSPHPGCGRRRRRRSRAGKRRVGEGERGRRVLPAFRPLGAARRATPKGGRRRRRRLPRRRPATCGGPARVIRGWLSVRARDFVLRVRALLCACLGRLLPRTCDSEHGACQRQVRRRERHPP